MSVCNKWIYIFKKILGITKNDEVLVPSITYIAPVNAICHNQANPVFMDCDEWNNLDIQKTLIFIKNSLQKIISYLTNVQKDKLKH